MYNLNTHIVNNITCGKKSKDYVVGTIIIQTLNSNVLQTPLYSCILSSNSNEHPPKTCLQDMHSTSKGSYYHKYHENPLIELHIHNSIMFETFHPSYTHKKFIDYNSISWCTKTLHPCPNPKIHNLT